MHNILTRDIVNFTSERSKNKKVIFISAPAGYGKTIFGEQMLSYYQINYGAEFISYQVDRSDNSAYHFGLSILNLFSKTFESVGTESIDVVEKYKPSVIKQNPDEKVISEITEKVMQNFKSHFSKDFYLLIDDFEILPSEKWVSNFINKIIDGSPDNLHFLFISTDELPIYFSKYIMKKNLTQIGIDTLKFSKKEISEIAENIYNKKLNETEIKQIEQVFEGWVTGIHIYLQASESITNINDYIKIPKNNVYKFFLSDIIENFDYEVKNFLFKTCYLKDFNADDCNKILGINNSSQILNKLSKKNIFIKQNYKNINGKIVQKYDYLFYFSGFLKLYVNEYIPKKETEIILNTVGEYYISQNNIIDAIEVFNIAEKYEKIKNLVLNNIEELINSGDFITAKQWLEVCKPNHIVKNPYLLYYMAVVKQYGENKLDESLLLYESANNLFQKENNELYLNKSFTGIADIFIKQNKYEEALKILNKVSKGKMRPLLEIYINYKTGIVYRQLQNSEMAKQFLDNSLKLSKNYKIDRFTNRIITELLYLNTYTGEFENNLLNIYNGIKELVDDKDKVINLSLILNSLSAQAEYLTAYEDTKYILELTENLKIQEPQSVITISLISFYISASDYKNAMELIYLNMSLFQSDSDKFMAHSLLGQCYIFFNDIEKAETEYQESLKYITPEFTIANFWNLYLHHKIILKRNNYSEAYYLAKQAYDLYTNLNIQVPIAKFQSNMLMAVSEYYIQNYNEFKSHFETAIKAARENKLYGLLIKKDLSEDEIFLYAKNNNIFAEVIKDIQKRVLEYSNYYFISPETFEIINKTLDKIYDIKVTGFGKLEILKNGVVIEDEKWAYKKWKIVFAQIFINRSDKWSKDLIIKTFFSDMDTKNAENKFSQFLSNLRKIFTIGNGKEDQLIVYKNKEIYFNDKYFYYSDVSDFDKLCIEAKQESDNSKKLFILKKILTVYKGKFLEGISGDNIETQRDKYSVSYQKILNEIIKHCKLNKNFDEVILYSEKLLEEDKLNEDAYLNIIETEAYSGNRHQAKLIYQRMQKVFKRKSVKISIKIIDKISSMLDF